MPLSDDSAGLVQTRPPVAVYIARHAQTASNLANLYAGRGQDPLTAEGRRQAEELADRLVANRISEVWTSEIARALETAGIVAARLGLTLKRDPRLNEMLLGPWEGLTEVEVEERYPDAYRLWNERPDQLRVGGRETLTAVLDRALGVVANAARAPAPVLLVTHVALVRVVALRVLGVHLTHYKAVPVPNAEVLAVDLARRDVRRLGADTSLREELALSGVGAA